MNSEKKDSSSYTEKFQHIKFACSVKQFGGRPACGALLLTTTGMLAAILLPQPTSQTSMIIATESLGQTRIFIKTADICYGKSMLKSLLYIGTLCYSQMFYRWTFSISSK